MSIIDHSSLCVNAGNSCTSNQDISIPHFRILDLRFFPASGSCTLSFFHLEKHEPPVFFIHYIKCAKRCRLEIISQSSHRFGREILHPEIYRGRPQCKAHPHRTKPKARGPCDQKISEPGGRPRGPALYRDDRADQGGRHFQSGEREPPCRVCVAVRGKCYPITNAVLLPKKIPQQGLQSHWRVFTQFSDENYLMCRTEDGIVRYAPLCIHTFRLIAPRKLLEAQQFNQQYHSYEEIQNVPDRLRWCRHHMGLMQKEVAEQIGISRGHYI